MTKRLRERYAQSIEQLARAETVIPLGSQTFSKSRTQYPVGAAPLFAERASGSHLWDVDGNEYVDLVSALGAVILGYADPDVDNAVRRQLRNGVTLSLATRLESEVAERIVELVPCAESVRFGKNDTDATSAAIRLASAFTGRDHVVALGYHGWQDWYIGLTTRDLGFPEAVKALTHRAPYNDLDVLQAVIAGLPDQVAAVIPEPMTSEWPVSGYLEGVRQLTSEQGIVLVFDEMLIGFRFAPGGAQEYFGVTPDLAAFGKALANGYPLSAIVGRADIMRLMEDVFLSSTFGGETLSLAAARAVLTRMATGEPTARLAKIGSQLMNAAQRSIDGYGASLVTLSGHPSWALLNWTLTDPDRLAEAKTLFLQEMLRHGVLVLGTHDITTAFTDADITAIESAYAHALTAVADGVASGDLRSRLECEPIRPLFTLR
ncbi:MAG: aminotransferase class III-fold pyridoxal phosphate-dependent enzyme [Candidatus Nanopelagicales bacterium]|nr:aminotransferase class III-fold pyridoxal phosphate-dependent enzyme [Candidatus Nanopelagicales bacterium]MCF8536793.1 aminotransferase class III-fold pyridoxal phosphate-dependent enzyme [Candidatus Nanopelagicales bacterium]MCF8541778.1 aminotransferase class III-fold pyridoxal phosphate-dependent enzyme [Candidatus Nanopelagicales bacterium]MCF8556181.1 aminotransferase class III-fold pyridoxal phosphate-dependent enzyme [Candidatus Nanopelagicales bacterium]